MNPTAPAVIEKAIHILGEDDITPEAVEQRMAALMPDPMGARRLIDWIPEAFGVVALSQLGRIALPTTFLAQDASGNWRTLPMDKEPLFAAAVERARNLFEHGHRALVVRIASRSTLAITANERVEKGASMENVVLTGPVMLHIPAEVYRPELKSWWRRVFG
jgi:hypothetical protein